MNSRRLIPKVKTLHKKSLSTALLCVMGGMQIPAIAQVADQNQLASLDTVKVSASTLASTTENVRSISAEDIEETQARNLDDLVRYIPGLAVDDLGRFGSNGINLRGLDGDRVAITVDGLSLGETLNPANNAPYEFFSSGRGGLDVDAIKAVELVKGADSIAAGSGALGGAVIFVTKDPADYLGAGNDTYLATKLGYASAMEEAMATVTLANRTGNWESMLIYTHRQGHERDSFYSGSRPGIPGTAREIPDPLDYSNGNLLAKLYYNPSQQHRLGLVVESYRSESQLDNQTRISASYIDRSSDDRFERERIGVNYLWRAGLPAFDELEWRYDYQESYTLGHTYMIVPTGCPAGANSPSVAPCARTEHRDYEQGLHKTSFDLSKAVGAHQVSYGVLAERKTVDYADVKTRFVGTTSEIGVGWPQLGGDFVPKTDVSAYSVYLRDRWRVQDDRLVLNAGVRYDRYEYSPSLNNAQYPDRSGTVGDVSFSSPTWQLGANWTFVPQHSVWVQAGGGFRAPTVEDMYFAPTTSLATEVATGQSVDLWNRVANPDLEAETSRNIELGYRWQTSRHLLGVSVYRNNFRDFIEDNTLVRNPNTEYQTCNAAGTQCTNFMGDEYVTLDNVGRATIEGAEIEGHLLITDGLRLRLAYSWNEGEDGDKNPLPSILPESGNLGLVYQSADSRWGVEGHLLFTAAKDRKDTPARLQTGMTRVPDDYFERYGSYQVFDLLGYYSFSKQLKVNVGIYNLFDEEYIRWQRIRFVGQESEAGGVRGGLSGDGIHRFTEPGRNYRLTISYEF